MSEEQAVAEGAENPLRHLEDRQASPRVISSRVGFHGMDWNVRSDTFLYGGEPVHREYVAHPGAVAMLAMDDDDRVLLINQYRHPVRHREWEIPAGTLDVAGEAALDTAKRELAEEADLEADTWNVLVDYYTTPGYSAEAMRIFVARGVHATPEPFEREETEVGIETAWVPLDSAVDAVLHRKLYNTSLVVGVLAAYAARANGWASLAPGDAEFPRRPVFDDASA